MATKLQVASVVSQHNTPRVDLQPVTLALQAARLVLPQQLVRLVLQAILPRAVLARNALQAVQLVPQRQPVQVVVPQVISPRVAPAALVVQIVIPVLVRLFALNVLPPILTIRMPAQLVLQAALPAAAPLPVQFVKPDTTSILRISVQPVQQDVLVVLTLLPARPAVLDISSQAVLVQPVPQIARLVHLLLQQIAQFARMVST